MGSVGNQNPWEPYNNNNNNYGADCSQGICSIYCPQFCYFFFPPPPPSKDDSTPFSPLIIAVIGVLASAFLLAGYYTLVTRYCNRRRQQNNRNSNNINSSTNINHSAAARADQTRCRGGLDESFIRSIAVRAYRKGDGAMTECAVCLSEFREKEPLRVLPKCSHAFHLPCIDTWLVSQSTCPLCRAAVVDGGYPYHQEVVSQRLDLVLEVLDDDDDDDDDETMLLGINNGHHEEEEEEGIVVIKRLGRSVSLRTDDEGKGQRWRGIIGTSEEEEDCVRLMMMKRSVSTGGLTFAVDDDGRGNS